MDNTPIDKATDEQIYAHYKLNYSSKLVQIFEMTRPKWMLKDKVANPNFNPIISWYRTYLLKNNILYI